MSKLEDIDSIEILKGHREKLVVKPCSYDDHINVNVGIQTLVNDREYRYRKGGFNVWPSAARELASALRKVAQAAEQAQERLDRHEDGDNV